MKDLFLSVTKAKLSRLQVEFDAKEDFLIREIAVAIRLLTEANKEVTTVTVYKTTYHSTPHFENIEHVALAIAPLARELEAQAVLAINGLMLMLPKTASKDSFAKDITTNDDLPF